MDSICITSDEVYVIFAAAFFLWALVECVSTFTEICFLKRSFKRFLKSVEETSSGRSYIVRYIQIGRMIYPSSVVYEKQ